MRVNKSLVTYVIITSLLFLYGIYLLPKKPFILNLPIPPSPTTNFVKPVGQITKVTRVVDGDTIEIEGNIKLRYIGIDTPETKHPTKGVQCFGIEASNKNRELVEGKMIRMEKDVSETDQYKRLLRYVWLIDENATSSAGLFINDYLVREGYAYATTFPPDVAYSKQFVEAQQEARENNRGLWNMCK